MAEMAHCYKLQELPKIIMNMQHTVTPSETLDDRIVPQNFTQVCFHFNSIWEIIGGGTSLKPNLQKMVPFKLLDVFVAQQYYHISCKELATGKPMVLILPSLPYDRCDR